MNESATCEDRSVWYARRTMKNGSAQDRPVLGAPMWMKVSAEVCRRLPMGRFRVMHWLAGRGPSTFIERMPGTEGRILFECRPRNSLASEVFYCGSYEAQETELVRTLLGPGDTFVDVGAHWGYFSLLAADLVGAEGRVLSIEADPRIFRTLSRNAALNGLPQLEVVHLAAAGSEGTITLDGYEEEGDNWGISKIAAANHMLDGKNSFQVRARAVDDMLDERAVGRVDLLKMDIEGAEDFALDGMQRGIRDGRYQRILLELHPAELAQHGKSAAGVLTRLRAAGYRGWLIDHTPEVARRAAYGRDGGAMSWLRPLPEAIDTANWPHVLLLAPGASAPAGLPRLS